MKRGFFSAYVALLGVLLLISLFYVQSTRNESVSQTDEVLVAQELLSRDWVLARNAYENFAADAMAMQVKNSGACVVPPDFLVQVNSYWLGVQNHLLQDGVNCTAKLDLSLYNELEDPDLPALVVADNKPAHALLTCVRQVGAVDVTLQHPFVVWKDVQTTLTAPGQCDVNVFDMLGRDAYSPAPSFVAQDANIHFTFP